MHSIRQLDRTLPESPSACEPWEGEEGFMLLAVVVMVALLLIALSVAAPVVARQLRRDKEIESQHRMNEYVRAIQLYQRRFQGQYPASIKVLENTNNIRFLRHVYVDPLTGKADYKLIHLGEQKTKIHVFFGQELDGLAANLGSAAGMQAGGAGMAASGIGGGSTTINSTSALSSGFSGATIGGSGGTGGLGSSTTGSSDSSSPSGSGGTGGSGATGTGSTSGTGSSSSSSSSSGLDSLGVIVGVGTSRSGTSITQPNGQTTYESWEFWYDPRIEMLKQGVNVTGGGMTGGGGTPGGGIGSQSASSYGQNAVTGVSNSPGNGSSSFGSFGSSTSPSGSSTSSSGSNSSTNPNSSVPNPF